MDDRYAELTLIPPTHHPKQALRQLATGGIELNLGKSKTHRTLACQAARLLPLTPESPDDDDDGRAAAAAIDPLPAGLGPRDPPIRYRASIPTSWLRLRLTEGKKRQVRRMTAAVGDRGPNPGGDGPRARGRDEQGGGVQKA